MYQVAAQPLRSSSVRQRPISSTPPSHSSLTLTFTSPLAPARGTSEPNFEPNGKFGVIVGDPVVSNVSAALSGVRGYPVQYPASSSVIIGGAQGRRDIVNRLIRQSALCPSQRFALVGYSQGASIMHQAADELPTSLYPKILALAMFGDPNLRLTLGGRFPAALEAKLLESCATRDPVGHLFSFLSSPSQNSSLTGPVI
jgi:cutinase